MMEKTKRLRVELAIAIVLATLLCISPSGGLLRADDVARPNIILMMCDDLGWGDVGFNGSRIIKTPHLDEMAAAGMKFNRFYSQAPVCSPTRGSCLTGRHPFRYGVYTANAGHMKPAELTLAELLKELGFTTGHFGKWHLGTLSKTVVESNRGGPKGAAHFSPPWQNGFDVCFSTEAKVPTFDPMIKPPGARQGGAWDYIKSGDPYEPYGTHYWNECGEIVSDNLRGDDARLIMDRAVPFIRRAAGQGRPFFAVVWFHTPHLPVVAGPEHVKAYEQYPVRARNYYGCVTAMDQQVGRLRKTLREAGVAENTLVFFCSDNGPEGNDQAPGSAGPFRGRKRSLYEGGVRVPGIVEWPAKVGPGSQTDFPAVTSDYLPTIVDIVGAEMPDPRPLDGISLRPLLEGKPLGGRPPIGFQSRNQVALSGQRFKLYRAQADGPWELYDLLEDPGESTDLADSRPDLTTQMATKVGAWIASCRKSDAGGDY